MRSSLSAPIRTDSGFRVVNLPFCTGVSPCQSFLRHTPIQQVATRPTVRMNLPVVPLQIEMPCKKYVRATWGLPIVVRPMQAKAVVARRSDSTSPMLQTLRGYPGFYATLPKFPIASITRRPLLSFARPSKSRPAMAGQILPISTCAWHRFPFLSQNPASAQRDRECRPDPA